jgi:aminoglycoside 6'-N-acetyltransferase I
MRIRKATKKDFSRIAELMDREYSKPPYDEPWKKKNAIKTLKYFERVGEIFVLVDKKILGFIISRDEYYNEGGSAVIEELIVDSNFQGRGFGRKLVEYVENRCRKKKIKRILLMTSNRAPAFHFYKKMGYVPSKRTALFRKELK